ncbi:MAG: hypothetical protein IJY12_02170 [Clostridia bacterium]|nr:hypothetical protein [Clostridia bacterium]
MNGHSINLVYNESIILPTHDAEVDSYFVDGDPDKVVILYEDGSLYRILYPFCTFNITSNASPDNVRMAIESDLGFLVDFSAYEYIEMPEDNNGEAFGLYSFEYYNQVDGYRTNRVRVTVSDDGQLISLTIDKVEMGDLKVEVDKEFESLLIKLRLQKTFNTTSTEFVSYKTHFDPLLVQCKGEIHVYYTVSVEYVDLIQDESRESYLFGIMIPLRLVNKMSEGFISIEN